MGEGAAAGRTLDLGHAALVLVGHGSARNPHSGTPTRRLARAMADLGVFAEVAACFWKESPFAREALALVRSPEVYVVPNFAGEGYFTREVIPREMNLTGPLTEHSGPGGRRLIHYTPPVGAHPDIAGLVLRRADAVAAAHRIDRASACLLLVGHGSRKGYGSGETTEALAVTLRASGAFAQVCTAFLEQDPHVADWPGLTGAAEVIVAPMLIADGLHGSEDLPPLFGLTTADLAAPGTEVAVGPAIAHGRRVWYCRGIGSDPDIARIILDHVTNQIQKSWE
ncbi:MAG: hypothetical protein HQL34_11860 [Alphaproteobacteria bacterium]|nr:hypothetical protein [Alphaproteobacteria bacterium]